MVLITFNQVAEGLKCLQPSNLGSAQFAQIVQTFACGAIISEIKQRDSAQ